MGIEATYHCNSSCRQRNREEAKWWGEFFKARGQEFADEFHQVKHDIQYQVKQLITDPAQFLEDMGSLAPNPATSEMATGVKGLVGTLSQFKNLLTRLGKVEKLDDEVKVLNPYKRPNNATTLAQRQYVQGKPCLKCGNTTQTQIAGHKQALVQEH